MQINGFSDIWKEVKELEEGVPLNEFAQYDLTTDEGKRMFEYHYNKHGVPLGMSRKEYKEITDILTSYDALPLGGGKEYDVYGYIAQNNYNVKFIALASGAALGVYKGNAITGTAVNYYHDETISKTIFRANPFRRLTSKAEDLRYKSDLDGGFIGLNYFKPITNSGSKIRITQQEYNIIREEILNGEPISIK